MPSPTPKTTKTTNQRLCEVFTTINTLGKDGTNTFHGFNYRSWESVVNHVKTALLAQKLVMRPSLHLSSITPNQGKDKDTTLTSVVMDIEFCSLDNPTDSLKYRWEGQGMDKLDLGIGKATSYALKDFLIKFFLLPDDPRHDPDSASSQQNTAGKTSNTQSSKQQHSAANSTQKSPGEGNISIAQVGLIWGRFKEKFNITNEDTVHRIASNFINMGSYIEHFDQLHWMVAKPLIDALCDTELELKYNKGKQPRDDIERLDEIVEKVLATVSSGDDDQDGCPF